jgi:hypothetical protein
MRRAVGTRRIIRGKRAALLRRVRVHERPVSGFTCEECAEPFGK